MRIHFLSDTLFNAGMKSIDDIRRGNLAFLAKENGGTSGLAAKLEKDPSQISQWINASKDSKTGKPRGMRRQSCKEIEDKLELGEGWMDRDHSFQAPSDIRPAIADVHFNAEVHGALDRQRYVAIVGTGQGGADGYISIDDYPPGQGDGQILSNSTDKAAYAIRVRGDSMRPRIRSGEYVIAEPSFEAQSGQDVVVRLKDGKAMVKELLFIADDEVRLGSVNDDVPPITVARDQIESIHRIGAIVPRASAVLRKPKGK